MHKYDSANEALVEIFNDLNTNGETYSPRGQETKEILDHCFQLEDPSRGICTLASRNLNYKLIFTEFLMYVCGWGDKSQHAELLVNVAPNYASFVNPTTKFCDGAYGPRLKNGFFYVSQLLAHDKDTRRAVMPIIAFKDVERNIESKDTPCTCLFNWRIRKDKLDLTVYMRSNDILWGTPYDVAAFTLVQRWFAAQQDLEVGTYTHFANSMHVYTDERYYAAKDAYLLQDDSEFDIPVIEIPNNMPTAKMEPILEDAYILSTMVDKEVKRELRGVFDDKYEDDPFLNLLWRGITGRFKKKG